MKQQNNLLTILQLLQNINPIMNFIPLTKDEQRRIKFTKANQQRQETSNLIVYHQQEPIKQHTPHPDQIGEQKKFTQKDAKQAENIQINIYSCEKPHINKKEPNHKKHIAFSRYRQIDELNSLIPKSLQSNAEDQKNIQKIKQPKEILSSQHINQYVQNKNIQQIIPQSQRKIQNCHIAEHNTLELKANLNQQQNQLLNSPILQQNQRRHIFVHNKPSIVMIPLISEQANQKRTVTPSKRQLNNKVASQVSRNIESNQYKQQKRKDSQNIVLGQADTYRASQDPIPVKMKRKLSPFSKETIPSIKRNNQKQKYKSQQKLLLLSQLPKNKVSIQVYEPSHADMINLKLKELKSSQGWDKQNQIFQIFHIPQSSKQASKINFKKPLNSLLLK